MNNNFMFIDFVPCLFISFTAGSASQSVTVDFERGFSLKSSGNRYQRNHPARFLGIRSGSYRNYRDRNAYYGRRYLLLY